jgi:hypothetical protein
VVAQAELAGGAPPSPEFEEAYGSFDVPDPSRIEGDLGTADPELQSQVWQAIASLGQRDYAALHLRVREGFSPEELGWVLGVNKGEAKAIAARMEPAADDVVRDYLLARRGSCPGLRDALAAVVFPPYSDEVRRAVEAHVKSHDDCTREAAAFPAPLPIFAAFAAASAPLSLKADVWRDAAVAWGAAFGREPRGEDETLEREPLPPPAPIPLAAGGAGVRPPYVPPPVAGESSFRNRALLFGGAAAGLLLFAFAGAALLAAGFGGGDDAGGPDPTRTAVGAGVSTPGAGTETAGPGVSTPTPDRTASVSPTAPPTEPPAVDTATPIPPTQPPPPPATSTPVFTRTPQLFFTLTPLPQTPTPEAEAFTPTPADE